MLWLNWSTILLHPRGCSISWAARSPSAVGGRRHSRGSSGRGPVAGRPVRPGPAWRGSVRQHTRTVRFPNVSRSPFPGRHSLPVHRSTAASRRLRVSTTRARPACPRGRRRSAKPIRKRCGPCRRGPAHERQQADHPPPHGAFELQDTDGRSRGSWTGSRGSQSTAPTGRVRAARLRGEEHEMIAARLEFLPDAQPARLFLATAPRQPPRLARSTK